jgi:hypothetical protein
MAHTRPRPGIMKSATGGCIPHCFSRILTVTAIAPNGQSSRLLFSVEILRKLQKAFHVQRSHRAPFRNGEVGLSLQPLSKSSGSSCAPRGVETVSIQMILPPSWPIRVFD